MAFELTLFARGAALASALWTATACFDSHTAHVERAACGEKAPCPADAAGSGEPSVDAGQSLPSLLGAVGTFADASFRLVVPFSGDGVIGAQMGLGRVTGFFHGGSYALSLTDPSRVSWLDVRVDGRDAAVLPTLVAADTVRARGVLPLVSASVMAEILPQFIGSVPRTDRAIVVVFFVNALGDAVQDVSVLLEPGARAAYDDGSRYSSASSRTHERGIGIIVDLDADPFPGSLSSLSYRVVSTGLQGALLVRTARGAVTLATVPIES